MSIAIAMTYRKDKNLQEKRGDFLLRRTDGVDIRLHPQKLKHPVTGLKEAHPVYGSWDIWSPLVPQSDCAGAMSVAPDTAGPATEEPLLRRRARAPAVCHRHVQE